MATLRRLSPVMPLVIVLSGVILSVVVRRPSPHCHPPPSLLLLLLLCCCPSLLLSLLSPPILRHCYLSSATATVIILPFPCTVWLLCLFFAVLVSFFTIAHHFLLHRCHVALHDLPSSLAARPSNPTMVDCCKRSLYCCISAVLGLARGLIWLLQGRVRTMTRNIIFGGWQCAEVCSLIPAQHPQHQASSDRGWKKEHVSGGGILTRLEDGEGQ